MKSSIRLGRVEFSRLEIREIVKAWIVISIAFGILLGGFANLVVAFFIALLTVGVGFIAHELGHKIVAQYYGAWAEFRAWNQGLILALIMSFFGLILAAPGAVMVRGATIGRSRLGKIAAAGPIMSYVVALLFVPLMFGSGFVKITGTYGAFINAWLGLFNMLPVLMLDGKKIWEYSKTAYFSLVLVGLAFIFGLNIF